jgi:hypothetical protein
MRGWPTETLARQTDEPSSPRSLSGGVHEPVAHVSQVDGFWTFSLSSGSTGYRLTRFSHPSTLLISPL